MMMYDAVHYTKNLTFVEDQYNANNIAFSSVKKRKKVTSNQHLQDSP